MSKVGSVIGGATGQFGIPSPDQLAKDAAPAGKVVGNLADKLGGGESSADTESDAAEQDASEATEGDANDAAKSNEDEATSDPHVELAKIARRRLAEAWRLTTNIEGGAAGRDPREHAPHLWRNLKERLLWYERLHHAGSMVKQRDVAKKLNGIVRQLKDLSGNSVSEGSVSDSSLRIQDVHCLGLAEVIAAARPQQSPEDWKERVEAFDGAINKQGPAQLAELIKDLDGPWERFHELQLAVDLLERKDISWEMKKLVLKTRRFAEQSAADLMCGAGWARKAIECADRFRWEAERLVQSRAASDWESRAREKMKDALVEYKRAQKFTQTVREAIRSRNEVLGRCRDYLLWHRLSCGDGEEYAPQKKDIVKLFDAVKNLDQALASPKKDVGDVEQRLKKLRTSKLRLESGIQTDAISELASPLTGNAWRMDVLIRTLLPADHSRVTLRSSLVDVSRELASSFQFKRQGREPLVASSSMTDKAWKAAAEQLELEFLAADLSKCAPDAEKQTLRESDPLEKLELSPETRDKLKEAGYETVDNVANASIDGLVKILQGDNQSAESLRENARWRRIESSGGRLAEFYHALPNHVSKMGQPDVNGSRGEQLAQLRDALRDTFLIAADVSARPDPNPITRSYHAHWFDLLVWHTERFRNASSDATAEERTVLLQSIKPYLRLAGRLPNQPTAGDPPALPQLELKVKAGGSLESQHEATLECTLRSNSSSEIPVWLVLQYNKELISVEDIPGVTVYKEHKLSSELREAVAKVDNLPETANLPRSTSQSKNYPYRPDLFGMGETLRLGPSDSETVKIQVRRKGNARGSAQIIVKALGGNAYVRHGAKVRLPGQQQYRLLVADPVTSDVADSDTWQSTEQGVLLQPYPNRVYGCAFLIENLRETEELVHVDLYIPERAAEDVVLPQGAMDASVAEVLLAPFGSRSRLGTRATVELPPNLTARVAFPPPEERG